MASCRSFNCKARLASHQDLEYFNIEFDAMLDHAEAFNSFSLFLEMTHNEEYSCFIKCVSEYRLLRFDKGRRQMAQEIVDKFIQEFSPYQLNLNSEIKGNIFYNIHHGNIDATLFDWAESNVIMNLREYLFQLYLKSDVFTTFILSQPLQTLFQIGVLKKDNPLYYISSFGDLESKKFIKENFMFLKHLALNDCSWKMIDSCQNPTCFKSNHQFDFGTSKNSRFYKFESILPFEMKHLGQILLKYNPTKKFNLIESKELSYVPKKKEQQRYASIISQETCQFQWPLSKRDFLFTESGTYDSEDDLYIFCKKSCKYELAPKTRNERSSIIEAIILQPIDEESTKLIQLYFIDLKGMIPRSITTNYLKKQAKIVNDNCLNHLVNNLPLRSENLWLCIQENGINNRL
ncbi:hypothetical protein ABK040_001157 [Willaertia magna]